MKIREARWEDAPGIAKVHVDSWRSTYRELMPAAFLADLSYQGREETWGRILADSSATPQELVFVAEEQGEIVGFVSGGKERSGELMFEGELYALYLLESHQRRGLGRGLLQSLVSRFEQVPFSSMLLWVLADNPARRFYERMGGVPVSSKVVTIGGASLTEIGYGWSDLTRIL